MPFSDAFSRTRPRPAIAGLALTALLLAGCGASPKPTSKKPAPRPITRIAPPTNWAGTYRGTAPCTPPATPACLSQQLVLTLLPDNTYELQTTVQRQGKPYTIVSKGRFQWDNTRTIITLASKDENARLRIGPHTAERLPSPDDDVSDGPRSSYILHKR